MKNENWEDQRYNQYVWNDWRYQTSHEQQVAKILTQAIERDFTYLGFAIGEGLPNTAAHIGRWLAQLAFEIRPDLRVDDKGMRYMARPMGCEA